MIKRLLIKLKNKLLYPEPISIYYYVLAMIICNLISLYVFLNTEKVVLWWISICEFFKK